MSNIRERETLITEIKTFEQFRQNGASLKNSTLQALDFTGKQVNWEKFEIDNTTFLGCGLSLDEEILLRRKGAYIYQAPSTLPYNPFRYGAPPHGGFAFGIDRLVAILAGEENIREVIAFPKTQSGADPMTNAPTPVSAKQLDELGIRVLPPKS